MADDRKVKRHVIIHGAGMSSAAVAGGLAQLPLADSAVLAPIQIAMVVALGKVFSIHLTDSAARGAVLSVAAGFTGRAVSQILVGWIPGIGNAINVSTAAGLTEAIRWAVASKFDRGEKL